MRKLIAAHKYPAVLACVSVAVLTLGMLLKPEKADSRSVVSEIESVRLRRLAEKRSLEQMTEFFSTVAGEAAAHIVVVPETRSAGIVWDLQGGVVTVRRPQSERSVRPLVFVQMPQAAGLAPAERATFEPEPGAWVMEVGRREGGGVVFTPGTYRGIGRQTCGETARRTVETSLALKEVSDGGGLFNLDGRLLGIVGPCGDRRVVFPVDEMQAAHDHRPTAEETLEQDWGARFSELTVPARQYFKVDQGLLITEVRVGRPAGQAGLLPGDVVVDAAGRPVTTTAELASVASEPGTEPVELKLVRNRRNMTLKLDRTEPTDAPAGNDASLGLELNGEPEGFPVGTVEPRSPSAAAGILPGDRLIAVDRVRLRRAADAARLLGAATQGPRFLELLRGDRRIGVLVL